MKIGRYEVVQELGQGGMAMVYLARDPYIKRQVAVKVLPRQFTFDPEFRARFQREAELIATFEHPAIVPVYDFGEDEDQPYIVMRYMPGGSLAERLMKGPVPIPEIAALFERIGSALDHAHQLGVIHRDIKPGNILFDAHGFSYLSDFGISKITGGTTSLTGTGIIGTPAYMSPEQAQGEKNLDGRCDIYSLGVVLFQVLTGELPYKADTPMGQAMAHITQPIPSLLERKPDLPPTFERIIRKTLDKSPDNRYQSASQLMDAIHEGEPGPVIAPEIRMTPAPPAAPSVSPVSPEPSGVMPLERNPTGMTPVGETELVSPISIERDDTTAISPASAPAARRRMPVGSVAAVSVLVLCLCIALIAGLRTGLIPDPFSSRSVNGGPAQATTTIASESPGGPGASPVPTLREVTQTILPAVVPVEASATALIVPSVTPILLPSSLPTAEVTSTEAATAAPSLVYFTATTGMLCREGPGAEYEAPWQLNPGEVVPVLAQWYQDSQWLLVDINVPAQTRTDCCWVGAEGTLSVSIDLIKRINFLPDRMDCSAVQ